MDTKCNINVAVNFVTSVHFFLINFYKDLKYRKFSKFVPWYKYEFKVLLIGNFFLKKLSSKFKPCLKLAFVT